MYYKASVIIPVYNSEKTLRRCVESIVLGNERNIEVILSEDCSKDNSWNVCLELAAEFNNVYCIRNDENRGVSYTRNQGLAIARGEYILFIDSDDWVSERYVYMLIRLAMEYQEALPICGQHFIDKVSGLQRDYMWDNQQGKVIQVDAEQYFDLVERFLLQQLWNKIFYRKVIIERNIRFDENQNMGEDFQFVLDYLEALQCKRCVVINEPLYYYIRWNKSSLMSKFGLVENQNEYIRFKKLLSISGEDNLIVQEKYEYALNNLKQNYIYQAIHSKELSVRKKIKFIEEVGCAEDAGKTFCRGQYLVFKEKIVSYLAKIRTFPERVVNRIQREKIHFIRKKLRSQVHNKSVTILSQNCIGGVLYHDLGLKFDSPTINLYFTGKDFVKLILNLKHYMSLDPVIKWGEEYPIGILEDLTIHFMHYDTCREASEAWKRRKERINYNKIIVLATDMEGFSNSVFEQWKKIPYLKLLFSAKEQYAQENSVLYYPEYKERECVNDLISTRLFYRNNKVISLLNSIE